MSGREARGTRGKPEQVGRSGGIGMRGNRSIVNLVMRQA